MIALDTNVLVRYLVDDDAEQARAARKLLEGLAAERPAFICREVMIELVWVLQRAYRLPRSGGRRMRQPRASFGFGEPRQLLEFMLRRFGASLRNRANIVLLCVTAWISCVPIGFSEHGLIAWD